MVEGGTLLRCYTSQRGIEGSNPSSSAPKAPRLQEQREGEEAGQVSSRPLLHQREHQRSQNALIRGREFESTATSSRGRLRIEPKPCHAIIRELRHGEVRRKPFRGIAGASSG